MSHLGEHRQIVHLRSPKYDPIVVRLRIPLAGTTRQIAALNLKHKLLPQIHDKTRMQVIFEPVLPACSHVQLHHQAPSRGRSSSAVVDGVDSASAWVVDALWSVGGGESDDLVDNSVANGGV